MLDLVDGTAYFHVGIGVPRLEEALEELSAGLNLTWVEPWERWVAGHPLRMTFSMEGPPYYEVLQAPPGSLWNPEQGRHIHFGYWTDDVATEQRRLAGQGFRIELDGPALGYRFGFLSAPHSGLWIELLDSRVDNPWRAHERRLAALRAADESTRKETR